MKILFAASEAAPFSKTGGLGDVAGALPQALAALGHNVTVVSPLYSTMEEQYRSKLNFVANFNTKLGWRNQYCGVFEYLYRGVRYLFIDNEFYFKRGGVYGYGDDGERFAFFSKAVVTMITHLDLQLNIIHANDWQTAMIPVYFNYLYRNNPAMADVKTVFTIHNLEYQGKFNPYVLGDLFGLPDGALPILEYRGDLNLVKGAVVCADAVTTVSPSYAREIMTPQFGFGLDNIISSNSGKLYGIINGIDTESYDPQTDPEIRYNFSAANMRNKARCKAALQSEFGLEADKNIPVVAMVGRMVPAKGLDLVCEGFENIMGRDLQFILLGSGESRYSDFFETMRGRYPQKVGIWIGFNAALARRIYAGADIFLMPSLHEPCGLAQMIAMRYAAVPLVRSVGGLGDTVADCRLGEGNGFCFTGGAEDLLDALDTALGVYGSRTDWNMLRKYDAGCDFSWNGPALSYQKLYYSL